MSFLETPRFPDNIAYGSAGGPAYSTRIVEYGAGYEQRDVMWSYARHEYDVAYGIRKIEDLYSLVDFFHAVRGRGYGFRYKDFADYKSCAVNQTLSDTDQTIGTGDGVETDFQLIKKYTKGSMTTTRYITKPVSGTVVISIDDVSQPSGWTVDTTTGIVTFASAPASSAVVKAGYEFDVPVRFNVDKISVVYSDYEAGDLSVPVVELKYHSVPQP